MKRIGVAFALLALVCSGAAGPGAAQRFSRQAEADWIRYTVPLPKEIGIADKVSLTRGSVAISAPAKRPLLVDRAVKELTEVLGNSSGKSGFTIAMILGGKQAEPLKKLKNSGQACRIVPVGNNRLEIIALEPHGIYYGSKTLQQLLKAKKSGSKIDMPLVTMTDWPDMDERGLWGGDNYEHLKWLGDRKMNWMEQISAVGVDEHGKLYAKPQTGRMVMFTEGPYYGINPVPVIGHIAGMTAINDEAVLKAFPKSKGKSNHAGVMCYSQPDSTVILTEWMTKLAALPNVTGIDQWLTENLHGATGCQCDLCRATGVDPMVLEARAVVTAWREAEKRSGRKIDLRILTSEETEPFNEQIFRELPKGTKIVYYHSLLTYNCIRAPQLQKYVEDWAKAGNWVAVCPNISTYPRVWSPFDSVQFVHYRIKEFTHKGLAGLLGYALPRVNYNRFNVEAAAEYAWNMNGRSEREFAVSWAVREGLKDPEKVADYMLAVGWVLWDCHGSEWPHRAFHWVGDPIDKRLKEGKVPALGYHAEGWLSMPFGNIKTEMQLNEDVELAEKALKLAREMRSEEFIQQARVARGLIRSLKALYELKLLAPGGTIAEKDKESAAKYFQMYVDSLRETMDALPKWETTIRKGEPEGMYAPDAVKTIREQLVDRMIATAGEMGFEVK